MQLIARLLRFIHCLPRLFGRHRPCTIWIDGRVTCIWCECGEMFYVSPDPTDRKVMIELCRQYHAERGKSPGVNVEEKS